MSFPRHAICKESGLAWLGAIPAHWNVIQSRRLFALRKERACADDRQLTASQKHGVIYQDDYTALEGQKVVQVLLGADILKHVEPDDFVISMRSFQGGIEWCAFKGSISSAYVVLIPSAFVYAPFFRYLLKCSPYIQALQSTSNLIRDGQALRYDNFTLIHLPLIPVPEQRIIATFLDSETRKIDALVAEQHRLIKLLAEKRQMVVSRAVTKGLHPGVSMRDSGVGWLGEIPEHWDVQRLKFIAEVQSGIAKGKDNSGHKTIEVPYLRVANVQDGYLDLETVTTIEIPANELERYRLRPGDVLMNEGGDYDKLGRGHIWNGEIDPCIHQNHVFAVRPKAGRSRWLNEITGSDYARFYFMTHSKQSTNLASISSTNIMNLPVVLPPPAEQQAILERINEQRARFDALISEASRAISLLQERRSALISAAVTGKIDVRGVMASQPETEAA